MEWDKNLYVGSSISHKKNRIKWKIIHNAGQLDIYVIALASNPKNLLDVIPAWELMQKHYPKKGKYIVGLAGSYDEAGSAYEKSAALYHEKHAAEGEAFAISRLGELEISLNF